MAKKAQTSRASALHNGRESGCWKGNGGSRGKVSVADSLRSAARSTSTRELNNIRGPSGQDGRFTLGGANDATSGSFRGVRGFKD